jgi:hypothetical protein
MEPKWMKSSRFERIGNFTLKGPRSAVFPLLCPVLEYQWLPGWKCTMAYSDSGIAEKDAIFHTVEMLGRKAVWTAITYQPDTFIEYLIVSGRAVVVRLSIALESGEGGTTAVTWRMLFTATSMLGRIALSRAFSEASFMKMMNKRENELNHFLEKGKMIDA